MHVVLNKVGECAGCMFFDNTFSAETCRYCERNPNIVAALRDNKRKQPGALPPEALESGPDDPLKKMDQLNAAELAQFGVTREAIDRMQRDHEARNRPQDRKRK